MIWEQVGNTEVNAVAKLFAAPDWVFSGIGPYAMMCYTHMIKAPGTLPPPTGIKLQWP